VKAIGTVAAGIGCRFAVQKITRCSSAGAVMADALSKADFNLFRRTAAGSDWALEVGPAKVPRQLLAWLANPVRDDRLGSGLLDEIAAEGAVLVP
jgi:ribose 1,5-bisphosphokinase PhnN